MMQKTYLSREMTRAMALDHPIGDPTGGAAYGEKNDPVSAIISIGTMFTASAGFTAFASMTLLQGMAFAGAALSLVGNVTGNKTLSKIGMAVGLVGGIGSLAEGAGWIDKTSTLGDTFGSAAPAASGAEAALSGSPVQDGVITGADSVAASGPDVAAAGAPSNLNAGPASAATGAGAPAEAGLAQSAAVAPASEGLISSTNPNLTAAAQTPAPALSPTGTAPVEAAAAGTPYDPATATRAVDYGYKPGVGPAAAGGTGYLDQFGAFAKANPMAAYGMINTGAQIAGGIADWASGKTDAELEALKAQTGYADAKALEIQAALDKEKTRRANLNAGYSQVNTGMAVNPNASIAPAWQQPATQPGLIAGARTA